MFGFPLLLIPLAVCNIIVFLMPGVSFAAPLFTVPLMSGAGWIVTLSDALVALGLLLLLLEVQKSARPGGKYVTDHLLAFVIFAGAAVEFVMLPQFANSTFFLLALIALVDFLSGLALRGRRPKRVREAVVVLEPAPSPVVVREASPEPIRPIVPMPVTQPVRAEPHHIDQIKAGPSSPDRIPVDLFHSTQEVANNAPPSVEPARVEPGRVEPARVEPIVDMDPMLGEPASDPKVETEPKPRPA